MLNPIAILSPQAAPAKSASRSAETPGSSTGVTSRNPAQNKPAGQDDNSFGAVLTRQIEEKNSAATENQPADAAILKAKRSSDAKDLQADDAKLILPDEASAALAAMLLVNPENRLAAIRNSVAAGGTDKTGISGKTDISGQSALRTDASADKSAAAIAAANNLKSGKTEADLLTNTTTSKPGQTALLDTKEFSANLNSASTPNPAATALAAASQQLGATGGTPAPLANNHIAAPLHSPAWPEEFSQKVSWISTQQNQTAELHLNPPDLGPLHIVLNVSDNQATALFSSPHSAVREAIENALPKLREIMADNGIMLGNATVNDQSPRDSGASGFMGSRAEGRSDRSTQDAGSNSAALADRPVVAARRHNGMVDTFA